MVYKIFTGNLPFLNEQSILNDEVPNLNELAISIEAKKFISCLLEKDKFKRLGSFRVFKPLKNPKKAKEDTFFRDINWIK